MIDLHTHILPGVDDGAERSEESIAMLQAEAAQGVRAVALTPHFYRDRETVEAFLAHRQAAYEHLLRRIEELPPEEREALPELKLGAEVTWMENCSKWEGLEQLCYEDTRYLLIEPPFITWNEAWFRDLQDLMNATGLTPVIAHLDRYLRVQKKSVIRELLSYGIPLQISAESLLHFSMRRYALELIASGDVQLLISDCHDLKHRKPNIGEAMQVIAHRLGKEAAEKLSKNSEEIFG